MPLCTPETNATSCRAWWNRLQGLVPERFRTSLVRNASWTMSAQGLQMGGRLAYFLIVAHVLGPRGYGTFVSCTALVATMAPFASWGTSEVMLKYAARDRSVLSAYFGNALLVTLGSSSLLLLFALILRPRVLPASATAGMLIGVAAADLLCMQVTTICLHAFMALEQFRRYTQLMAWSMGMRFIAALVLIACPPTPQYWAYLYSAAAAIAAIGGLVSVARCCASPRLQLNLLVPSVREGFHFSTSTASQSVYNDIDKTMLARLSSVEAAAIYAVAYRFVDAAMLPVRSLAAATYPEFFRQGQKGVTSTFRLALRLLRRSVVFGMGAAVVLFLAAGLLPKIFGQAYAESALALRWLCFLPVVKSVHAFLTDTLTGANYQWQRSSSDIFVAVFNVVINLWLIRAFAWRGAAWSSLMTDSLLAVVLYMIIRWHLRNERERRLTTAQPSLAGQE